MCVCADTKVISFHWEENSPWNAELANNVKGKFFCFGTLRTGRFCFTSDTFHMDSYHYSYRYSVGMYVCMCVCYEWLQLAF